jgi:hypothetical protein
MYSIYERDRRCRDVDTRGSVDIAPTDILSGDARGSQQKNFFFSLQKFKAKLES